MPIRYRHRTKGKNSWFNWSASKTGGIGWSYSIKLGDKTTLNLGKHGKTKLTHNFGNGFTWSKTSPTKKPRTPKTPKTSTYKTPSITRTKATASSLEQREKQTKWQDEYVREEFYVMIIACVIFGIPILLLYWLFG